MNDLGVRLREERERLKRSQDDFAALAGMKKNAQLNYEKGLRTPDAKYLTAIHEAGADILYITTGVRGGHSASAGVSDEQAEYHAELTPIAALVDAFEKATPEMQQAVLRILGKD